MRWDPSNEYKELVKKAKDAVSRESNPTEVALGRGVLELVDLVIKDEQAINHVLDKCGGHLTLATLKLYYEAHENTLDDWRSAAKKIVENPISGESLEEALDLCRLIAKSPL